MASTVSAYRPWRVLGPFLLGLVALVVWTFWPGQPHSPQLGLDLQGGTQVTLLPTSAPGSEGSITDEQLDQAVAIIRQRVDGLGVAEAEVTVQGSGDNAAIIVSVPTGRCGPCCSMAAVGRMAIVRIGSMAAYSVVR